MYTVLVNPTPRSSALDKLRGAVHARFGPQEPVVVQLQHAEQQCREHTVDAAFVLLSPAQLDRTLDVVQRLHAVGVNHVMVVGPARDPKLILRVMQAGADLFVDEAELEWGLDAAAARIRRRAGGEAPTGRLLTVLAAGGGDGASTVAVNLAALLAKARGRSHLIDLNPGKGDLAPLLDLKPQYTFADLCRNESRMDQAMYEKLLARGPEGICLLAAPHEFDEAEALTARAVDQAITLARALFPEVVIDLGHCRRDDYVTTLQHASTIFVVTRLTFTAVRNTRRVLDYLSARSIPQDRVKVVVNHYGLPGELPATEAEQALGVKLTSFVPHDPETINAANNTGTPAALRAPSSAVVESIGRLIGLEAPKDRKSEIFRRVGPAVQRFLRPFTAAQKPGLRTDAEIAASPL